MYRLGQGFVTLAKYNLELEERERERERERALIS